MKEFHHPWGGGRYRTVITKRQHVRNIVAGLPMGEWIPFSYIHRKGELSQYETSQFLRELKWLGLLDYKQVYTGQPKYEGMWMRLEVKQE